MSEDVTITFTGPSARIERVLTLWRELEREGGGDLRPNGEPDFRASVLAFAAGLTADGRRAVHAIATASRERRRLPQPELQEQLGIARAPALYGLLGGVGAEWAQHFAGPNPFRRHSSERSGGAFYAIDPGLAGELLAAMGTHVVLLTDLHEAGSARARLGDDAWGDVVATYEEVVRRAHSAFPDAEVAHLGDGFVLVFTSILDAAHCATDIVRGAEEALRAHGVAARVGIHEGGVVRRGRDVAGAAVEGAARGTLAAGPGDIVASEQVARELSAETGFESWPLPPAGFGDADDRVHLFSVRPREGAS